MAAGAGANASAPTGVVDAAAVAAVAATANIVSESPQRDAIGCTSRRVSFHFCAPLDLCSQLDALDREKWSNQSGEEEKVLEGRKEE